MHIGHMFSRNLYIYAFMEIVSMFFIYLFYGIIDKMTTVHTWGKHRFYVRRKIVSSVLIIFIEISTMWSPLTLGYGQKKNILVATDI